MNNAPSDENRQSKIGQAAPTRHCAFSFLEQPVPEMRGWYSPSKIAARAKRCPGEGRAFPETVGWYFSPRSEGIGAG
jgi:hypothetical protein